MSTPPPAEGPRVAVIGHLCVDIKPTGVDYSNVRPGGLQKAGPLETTIGGAVANTGRVLSALGVPCRGFGAVGDDMLGALVAAEASRIPRMEVTLEEVAGGGTSYSLVVEPEGKDRAFWNFSGVNDQFDGARVPVGNFDLVHVGYPSLVPGLLPEGGEPLARLMRRARAADATTSLDLAVVDTRSDLGQLDWEAMLRAWGPLTDIISPSYDDLASALGLDHDADDEQVEELIDRLLDWGYGVVCISSGPAGLWLGVSAEARLNEGGHVIREVTSAWAGARARVPARQISGLRTTTGAGDSATAGLLSGVLDRLDPASALQRAANVAAQVLESGGIARFSSPESNA